MELDLGACRANCPLIAAAGSNQQFGRGGKPAGRDGAVAGQLDLAAGLARTSCTPVCSARAGNATSTTSAPNV